MAETSYRTTLVRDGPACFIPVPFDPRPLFGKVRAPVVVTLNGYSYSRQREHAEALSSARKPETRLRRIARIAEELNLGD